MAKKKLTPYEKAQRQFVQTRLTETGLEASPETRQRFRQRFETLASEKQGRTKLAQKLLPGEGAEERRSFKRMLATDMPARGGTGGGATSSYKVPTAKDITAGWQQAVQSGSYKVPTPAKKVPVVSPPITKTSSKGSNVFGNRRNNIIGQGINYPGRESIERFLNPLGGSGGIKDYSPKGIAKAAGQELAEAAILVGPVAKKAIKGTAAIGKFGTNRLTRLFSRPGGGAFGTNRLGGVGKVPYGPTRPASPTGQLALGPGPTQAATSTVKAATVRTARLNTKGGVGGQPYGPQRPYGPYLPPAATTKAATTKAATTKTTPAKKTIKTKEEVVVAKAQGKYPGATESDAKFLASVNRAQKAIEKQSEGYQAYAKFLKNPETQSRLAQLRRKK